MTPGNEPQPPAGHASERIRRALAEHGPAELAIELARFHRNAHGQAGDGAGARPANDELVGMTVESLAARVRRAATPPTEKRAEELTRMLQLAPERFERRILRAHGRLPMGSVRNDSGARAPEVAALVESAPGGDEARDVCEDLALVWAAFVRVGEFEAAERFLAAYAGYSEDFGFYPLVVFYVGLHALEQDRDAPSAPLASPLQLIATGGLVGTGKTTLARDLAERLGLARVNSDRTRVAVLEDPVLPTRHESDWERNYREGFTEAVYAEVFRRADSVLASGRSVIIDGCFGRAIERSTARLVAERHGAQFRFVETSLPRAVHLARLREREIERGDEPGAWRELLERFEASREPVDELESEEHCEVSTDRAREENASEIAEWLRSTPR